VSTLFKVSDNIFIYITLYLLEKYDIGKTNHLSKTYLNGEENTFSIRNLLENKVIDVYKTYKKSFFSLSNNLEDDDSTSMLSKRELVVSKLISDKSIMNERTYFDGLYDKLINQIYLAFSCDSRKILKNELDEDESEIHNYLYHLIKFNKDDKSKKTIITNDMILHLNSKILNAKTSKILITN